MQRSDLSGSTIVVTIKFSSCLRSLFFIYLPTPPILPLFSFLGQFSTTPLSLSLHQFPPQTWITLSIIPPIPSSLPLALSLLPSQGSSNGMMGGWAVIGSFAAQQRPLSRLPPPSCSHPSPWAHTDWEAKRPDLGVFRPACRPHWITHTIHKSNTI